MKKYLSDVQITHYYMYVCIYNSITALIGVTSVASRIYLFFLRAFFFTFSPMTCGYVLVGEF